MKLYDLIDQADNLESPLSDIVDRIESCWVRYLRPSESSLSSRTHVQVINYVRYFTNLEIVIQGSVISSLLSIGYVYER